MKLLSVIKSVCMAIGAIVVTNNICSMELIQNQNKLHVEILARDFVKKIPSDTFAQACTRSQNQGVLKRPSFKNNCYKPTLTFDVATKLPYDVQQLIVLKLFNNNKERAEMFLNMPIAKAIEACAYAKEVMAGKVAQIFKNEVNDALLQAPHGAQRIDNIFVDSDAVFELAKHIKIVDVLLQRDRVFAMVSREELKSLIKVIEKNPFLVDRWRCYEPYCRTYKTFTVSLFKEHFKNAISSMNGAFMIANAPLLLGLVSRVIETQLCNKVVIESIIQENSTIELVNAWIAQSGDRKVRSYQFPMLSIMDYSTNDYFKMYMPYVGLLLWFPISDKIISDKIITDCNSLEEKKLLVAGWGIGLLFMAAMLFIIPREYFMLANVVVVIFQAALCCIPAIIDARSPRNYKVLWSDISNFLKREDILIL